MTKPEGLPTRTEFLSAEQRRWYFVTTALTELWLAGWWLGCAWLNYAVACHRWIGWPFVLSMGVSSTAALVGWCLVRRAAARFDDAWLGELLARVEDAPAWAFCPHPAQIIKREHAARCRRQWGVTTRTSGWQRFRRSWRKDAMVAFTCLVVLMHAWWT